MTSFEVKAIGRVASPLTDPALAPRQADEGAPEAWLVFEPEMLEGLGSIRSGDEVIVLTWLDRARRDVLSVHPRGDISRALEGVFSTRSPHRPNPIGLHLVEIAAIDGRRLRGVISKWWMGRRSSTSSRYSAETSANAEKEAGGDYLVMTPQAMRPPAWPAGSVT